MGAKHAPCPTGPDDTFHATSVSGEAIYRLLNPYFDPIGLAVYFEPTFGDNTRELEAKVLLQKNFFNDTLRLAANINFEDTWERDEGRWEKGSAAEFFAGAAYNITPELSVGVEFNNENDFEGLFGELPETAPTPTILDRRSPMWGCLSSSGWAPSSSYHGQAPICASPARSPTAT